MTRVETACLLAGALLLVAGVGFIYWPVSLIVAGALLLVAGLDVKR